MLPNIRIRKKQGQAHVDKRLPMQNHIPSTRTQINA
jgi:hypothetical protein